MTPSSSALSTMASPMPMGAVKAPMASTMMMMMLLMRLPAV